MEYEIKLKVTENTPVAMLTVGQLAEFLGLSGRSEDLPHENAQEVGKRYVYGLKGICDLFHVSKSIAIKYKETILKDACYQSGHKIVCDVEKALKLFDTRSKSL